MRKTAQSKATKVANEEFLTWAQKEFGDKIAKQLRVKLKVKPQTTFEEKLGLITEVLYSDQPQPKIKSVVIGPVPNLHGRFDRTKRTRFW